MPLSFAGAPFPPDPARLSTANTFTANQTVVGTVSSTQTVFASAVNLSSVTFTSETTATPTSTATDSYVKVIVNEQVKYLRLFDL